MDNATAPVMGSLYAHVPFCAHKCEYCAFYSHAANGDIVNRYVQALIAEMGLVAERVRPKTVFFGGGTPSLLNMRQWEDVLKAMERLNLLGAEEWTVECNPATVSLDKAKLLRSFGVNRVSMGVQSLDARLLEKLGRIHSREMVFKSFDTLRQAGFDNINVDLMFAIPGQTMEIWRKTLDEAMDLGSEHLSSYEVIYEEDTPLYEQLQAGEFEVDEDLACDMYSELIERSSRRGFVQYEIANFARNLDGPLGEYPDRACRHNVNYWRGGFFAALGPSAAGYEPAGPGRAIRTKNWSNTTLYCEQLEKGRRAIESSETLEPLARAGELAAFGLRMNSGWPFQQFREVTGFDLLRDWKDELDSLVSRGWGSIETDRFRLTSAGLRFADAAGSELLRP